MKNQNQRNPPQKPTCLLKACSGGILLCLSLLAIVSSTPAQAAALPNLVPYQPSGWSDKIVVSTVAGATIDSSPLYATNTLYVDWAVINNGTAATTNPIITELYVDGALNHSWNVAQPLNTNQYGYVPNYPLGNLSVGTHTIRIKTDATSTIPELNEADNEYTKTIAVLGTVATVHYVNGASVNPVSPYLSWETAARVIQDAVDVCEPGGLVLVSNGVYQTGGRVVQVITNRVAITRPLKVQSVNGPALTIIQGRTESDSGTVRCVYLAGGATLSGFTLTNGVSDWLGLDDRDGGGVWCESPSAMVSNCVITGNLTQSDGGGAYGGTLLNCTLVGNRASNGGGAFGSSICDSVVTNNVGGYGGGVYGGVLSNCTLVGNRAQSGLFVSGSGGGAESSTLVNCHVLRNSADDIGGGADECTLLNCVLDGNTAREGGGAYFVFRSAKGCLVINNTATSNGGGVSTHLWPTSLTNCTIIGNQAENGGGGTCGGNAVNCIIYNNKAQNGDNYSGTRLTNCCTFPIPDLGSGNITAEPRLSSASHLSASSPCRGAGSAAFASGTDLDGEAWANPPSIGCDEYRPGAVAGAITASIRASYTNVASGFEVELTGYIDGRVSASRWEFGDGTVVSNQPCVTHRWVAARDYAVVLRAYNESTPGGVSATVLVHVVAQPVHYVKAGNPTPVSPYISWATAATNIQNAVDAASVPGALVLVSNGVYQTGGRDKGNVVAITNRVAVDKPLVVSSVNGPEVTIIKGQAPGLTGNRCVYLTNRAVLSGFTLTAGAAISNDGFSANGQGGGVLCQSGSAVVTNCIISGNSAGSGGGVYGGCLLNCRIMTNSAVSGGGTYWSRLVNCTLAGNFATNSGGGAYDGQLNSCLILSNRASYGGGVFGPTLKNCTLVGNMAKASGGGASASALYNSIAYYNVNTNDAALANYGNGSSVYHSCTTPLPSSGDGNIADAPQFTDLAGNDLRLAPGSPCIDAGDNSYVSETTDLDSHPRICGETVDLGAYESQGSRPAEFIAWLQAHGLPTDGSADTVDADHDGLNNWQEWLAGTDPTNAASVLRFVSASRRAADLVLSWQSVPGKTYRLERRPILGGPAEYERVATNLSAPGMTATYTHTNAVQSGGSWFYRLILE